MTGEKIWISNAPDADIYTVFARTTQGARARGVTAFAVAGDSPGLSGEPLDMLSPHPIGRLEFDGVLVGRDAVLGEVDAGFVVAMRTLDLFRPSVGAFAVGMAQAALDATIEHVANAGSTARRWRASRRSPTASPTWPPSSKPPGCSSTPLPPPTTTAPNRDSRRAARRMAKLYATEAAQQIIDGAVQLHGAVALRSGHLLEHLYRDVRSLRIYEGASEIQRSIIARDLIGRDCSPMTEYRFHASPALTENWQHFRFAKADGVATVTLDRPEKLNPLTFESYADLRDLLAELPHHQDVRALVIQGEGRGFCGGGDVNEIIGELIKMEPRDLMRFTKMTGDVIRAMRECPVPIITKIHGIAAGAGAVIALASDFRVVSTSGRFAFLFTKVGLSGGDMGAAYLLPRVVGLGRATELLMLGNTIDSATAKEYGLASRLVADDEVDAAVADLARTIAEGPTLALAQTKSLLTRELDMPIGSAMELDAMTQALLMTSKDHAEFHAAFNERRPPRWEGR